MSKSKLREITKCKNCRICDKVTIIQEHNDIDKLLANVQLWDTKIKNQYKHIKMFECLICSFKTQQFNEWKCHITSISHLAEYHMIQDTYSHVCDYKKCKVLLFGSKKSLCEHTANHSDKLVITSISILMAEVMNRYISKKKPFYYCFHCKRSEDKPIHTIDELLNIKKKNFIEYYCSYCRVTFVCSPEMLDYHSLSVEHMTIKCLDQLFSKGKVNSKKIKLSAKSIPTIEIKSLSTIQIPLISNSLKFPSIILHRFKNINEQYGECKLCSISVDWDCSNILKHLFDCKYKIDLTGKNKTSFRKFVCFVCDYTTCSVTPTKYHISSLNHLSKCYDTANLYSYFCKICNVYMYGHFNDIFDHQNLTHNKNELQLPKLSIFMADMFKIINEWPNKDEIVHYEGINEPIESSNYTSLCCYSCKIQFESVIDYEMHEITNEHIILKFLTPKNLNKSLKHGHDLTIASKLKTTKSSVISDISLSSTLVAASEQKSVRVNERVSNVDVGITTQLDGVKETQEPPINIVGWEKSDKNLQKDNTPFIGDSKLIHNQDKPQYEYTKYFNNKMKLLKLLEQFKDRIIKALSYYCDTCDFMAEDKYTWDKHIEMKHLDNTNICLEYCTICSMMILSNNFEEHKSSTEHCNLLKYLQSFNNVEKDLRKSISPITTVKGDKHPSNKRFIELNTDTNAKSNSVPTIVDIVLSLNNNDSQHEQHTSNSAINIESKTLSIPNNSLTILPTVLNKSNFKTEETNSMIDVSVSKDCLDKNENITNETSNIAINIESKTLSIPNNSLTILPTVLNKSNFKIEETNSMIDVSVSKDCLDKNENITDETPNVAINIESKTLSIPNNSLTILPTVLNKSNFKTEETNSMIDVSVSKDCLNKNENITDETSNVAINIESKTLSIPNNSLTILPTVLNKSNFKTEETNSMIDVSVSKDCLDKNENITDETSNVAINNESKTLSIPNNSLTILPTVLNKSNFKTEETNSMIDVSVSKDCLDKNELAADEIPKAVNNTCNQVSSILNN